MNRCLFLFVAVLSHCVFLSYSMESENRTLDEGEQFALILVDGQKRLELSQEDMNFFSTFQNMREFSHDEVGVPVIDVADLSFEQLGIYSVKMLLDGLKNPQNFKNIEQEKAIQVYETALYLGVPRCDAMGILEKNLRQDLQHPKEGEVVLFGQNACLLGFYHNTIQTIGSRGYNIEMNQNGQCVVDLSSKKLDSLEGLEGFAALLKQNNLAPLHVLELANNNLKGLKLAFLVQIFPYLQELNVNNNALKKVVFSGILPDMKIDLSNNKLTCINGDFRLGRKTVLDVRGNPLDEGSVRRLKKLTSKRPWIDYIKAHLELIEDNASALMGLSVLSGIILSPFLLKFDSSGDSKSMICFKLAMVLSPLPACGFGLLSKNIISNQAYKYEPQLLLDDILDAKTSLKNH